MGTPESEGKQLRKPGEMSPAVVRRGLQTAAAHILRRGAHVYQAPRAPCHNNYRAVPSPIPPAEIRLKTIIIGILWVFYVILSVFRRFYAGFMRF